MSFIYSLIKRDLFVISLLLLINGLVFANSLQNGFVLDDVYHIVNAKIIHSPGNIPRLLFTSINNPLGATFPVSNYYRGLMSAAFSLLYFLGNGQPYIFHAAQIIIHGLNSVFLFYLFKRYTQRWLAFVLSLLFLIHPANQEAVVYISNLQDVLFFFFGIAALLMCMKKESSGKSIFLASILLLLSLLSKETAILFIILAILHVMLQKNTYTPRYMLSFAGSFIIYLIIRTIASLWYFVELKPHNLMALPLYQKLTLVPGLFSLYLREIIIPTDSVFAPSATINSLSLRPDLILILLVIFILSIVYMGKQILSQQRKYFTVYVFFIIWFLTGVGLHLHLLTFDALIAKRWLYFPLAGFIGGVGIYLQTVISKPKTQAVFYISITLLCMVFAVQTIRMNVHWKNENTIRQFMLK